MFRVFVLLSWFNWLELHFSLFVFLKGEKDENERLRMLHAADRLEVSLRRAYVTFFFDLQLIYKITSLFCRGRFGLKKTLVFTCCCCFLSTTLGEI